MSDNIVNHPEPPSQEENSPPENGLASGPPAESANALPEKPQPAGPASNESDSLIQESMEKLDGLLKAIRARKQARPAPGPKPPLPKQEEPQDPNARLISLVEGKLDAMGDKISERLAALLGELKNVSGAAREAKIKEIHELAGPEIIDISKLFDEKVASNIKEIGIEEKETAEIDKGLEKLRKLRGGK